MRALIEDPARHPREPAVQRVATTAALTVYASIGNSDDKLTQAQWSEFHDIFAALIRTAATQIFGDWLSASNARWQNACVAFEIDVEAADRLKRALVNLAAEFNQESIAWAETTGTQFLGPGI
jgi:hypothetical protein